MSITSQQEIYNDIIAYYNFAQKLIDAVSDSNHSLSTQQFEIIEGVVENLEKSVEKLSLNYIEMVKNGESSQVIQKIRDSLNEISAKTQECRNKILMLYQEN